MAEVVSELDKLREAAKLIEEMSQGRLQVCPSVVGQVYIRPENEAYLGLDMRINSIPGQLRYRVTFSSQMRRMGADMTSEGLRALLSEVGQTYALLTALESRSYTPTTEDLTAFREELLAEQEAITSSCRMAASFSPVPHSKSVVLRTAVRLRSMR